MVLRPTLYICVIYDLYLMAQKLVLKIQAKLLIFTLMIINNNNITLYIKIYNDNI